MKFNAFAMMDWVNDELTSEVKKIVEEVVSDVIDFSPTPERSKYSEGSYVLSHRVALDSADNSFTEVSAPVTMAAEEAFANCINKIDDLIKSPIVRVIISNNVGHALAVETGMVWKSHAPYHVYEKATAKLMEKL